MSENAAPVLRTADTGLRNGLPEFRPYVYRGTGSDSLAPSRALVRYHYDAEHAVKPRARPDCGNTECTRLCSVCKAGAGP